MIVSIGELKLQGKSFGQMLCRLHGYKPLHLKFIITFLTHEKNIWLYSIYEWLRGRLHRILSEKSALG